MLYKLLNRSFYDKRDIGKQILLIILILAIIVPSLVSSTVFDEISKQKVTTINCMNYNYNSLLNNKEVEKVDKSEGFCNIYFKDINSKKAFENEANKNGIVIIKSNMEIVLNKYISYEKILIFIISMILEIVIIGSIDKKIYEENKNIGLLKCFGYKNKEIIDFFTKKAVCNIVIATAISSILTIPCWLLIYNIISNKIDISFFSFINYKIILLYIFIIGLYVSSEMIIINKKINHISIIDLFNEWLVRA